MSIKIAIIGGGAAGLICAATILEETTNTDLEIHLFEKNPKLGVKVAISGGGRCNLTTGITAKKELLSKYIRGGEFLYPALAAFSPSKVREWFADHGVPTKEEEDRRVFPVSDIGQDVVTAFEKVFQDSRITVHYRESIKQVKQTEPGKFSLISNSDNYEVDILVVTTGGNAYRHTGSTGDGYDFAREFGHSTSLLGPSLNSFETADAWCKDLSGLSFTNAKFSVILSNNEKRSAIGPMLFTHFGISGPAVFALAAHVAFAKVERSEALIISFIPDAAKDFSAWDKSLTAAFSEIGARQVANSLHLFLPKRFVEKLLQIANISPSKKAAEVSKSERRTLAHLLSGELKISLTARRAGDEFVTAGGINLNEVERRTMRSKLNPNLYFAGEVLDIDGLTGGFNLQAAWATGRLAAKNIILGASLN